MRSAVLLVHGDKSLRESVREALERAGHAVQETNELETAWRQVSGGPPDLIMLPWTASKAVRDALVRLRDEHATRRSRVIVWAARSEIEAAVGALDLGADDCLAVPFSEAELVARVSACLRREPAAACPDRLCAGPLVLDKAVHSLTVGCREVELAPTEFRLLAFFLENQGRVFGRDELVRRAWSKNVDPGQRTVDVHVRRLRQLLEPFGCDYLIQTVRGFGYRFALYARDARVAAGAAPERLGNTPRQPAIGNTTET